MGGKGKGVAHLTFDAEVEGAALTAALDHALPGPVAARLAQESADDRRSSVSTSTSSGARGALASARCVPGSSHTPSQARTVADLVWRSPAYARLLGQRVQKLLADRDRIRSECKFDGAVDDAAAADGGAAAAGGTKGAAALAEVLKLVEGEPRCHVDAFKLRDLVVREVAEPLIEELVDTAAASGGDDAAGSLFRVPPGPMPSRMVSVQDEKGSRSYMEDKFMVCEHLSELCCDAGGDSELAPATAFYAVYDGHSGKLAADYARQQLFVNVARDPAYATDLRTAVANAYRITDARFAAMASRDSMNDGTTCVTLAIRGDQLHIHWCGDSEALVSRGIHGFEPMGPPHTPAREDEKARIQQAGGTVVWFGTWRVNGTLGVARSLGDVAHSGIVTADTDYRMFPATDVAFVLLASDGLFDVLTHADAVNITRAYQTGLHGGMPAEAAQALVGEAIRRKTKDNVTAIVVYLSADGRAKAMPPRPDRPRLPQYGPDEPMPLPFADDFREAREAAAAGQQ